MIFTSFLSAIRITFEARRSLRLIVCKMRFAIDQWLWCNNLWGNRLFLRWILLSGWTNLIESVAVAVILANQNTFQPLVSRSREVHESFLRVLCEWKPSCTSLWTISTVAGVNICGFHMMLDKILFCLMNILVPNCIKYLISVQRVLHVDMSLMLKGL